MTEIVLQSGETLCIRSARGTLLVLRSGPSWEIRVVKRNLAQRLARALVAFWLSLHRRGAWGARRYLQVEEERRRALLRALG